MPSYDEYKAITTGLFCRQLPEPFVTPFLPPGNWATVDEMCSELGPNENPLVHYVSVICDFDGQFDVEVLGQQYVAACEKSDFSLLPAPFGLKAPHPDNTKLQLCIYPLDGGKHNIVKHCAFPSKMKAQVFSQLTDGVHKRLTFVHPKIGIKAWQYAFEHLGGYQLRSSAITPKIKDSRKGNEFYEKSGDDIDSGFDYILAHGPRSNYQLRQMRWMTKALGDKSCPLHGWPVVLVEKALRNLTAEGALARKETIWYLVHHTHGF